MKSWTTLIALLGLAAGPAVLTGCGKGSLPVEDTASDISAEDTAAITMKSAIPDERLQALKGVLPKVAYPKLQEIFGSSQTYWYDHNSLSPSYQAAVTQPMFASANTDWLNPIAGSVRPTANQFFDDVKKRWRFPFGTTAGTDDAENIQIVNFLYLPAKNGRLLPVVINKNPRTSDPSVSLPSRSWGWIYPNETVLGELIFIKNSAGELLPTEVRLRTRYAAGWAVNVFRPFPTASKLSSTLKARAGAKSESLQALIDHLDNTASLTAARLRSETIPNVFDQDGAEDVLPPFADAALVKELLTQTVFVSAYGTAWKSSNGKAAFAATTTEKVSIVPEHYTAGLIEVREASCVRCHQETGRGLTTFKRSFSDILLYGDMWGRDGIFSFHPFDENQFKFANFSNTPDNRRLNPSMQQQGLIAIFQAATHGAPLYPTTEIGFGK